MIGVWIEQHSCFRWYMYIYIYWLTIDWLITVYWLIDWLIAWLVGCLIVDNQPPPSLGAIDPRKTPAIGPTLILDRFSLVGVVSTSEIWETSVEGAQQARFETPDLVGGWPTPLKNMKVSRDYYPQYMEKQKMFQTTNQFYIFWNKANYNSLFQEQICRIFFRIHQL